MPGQSPATGCPPDILELIPWYPDEGLSDAERGAVEAHAACCVECRRELHSAFGESELPADAPAAERVLARVFERIAERSHALSPRAAESPPPTLAPPARLRAPRRAPVWYPAAAAAAAAAIVLGLLFLAPGARRFWSGSSTLYHTATAPPVAPRSAGPELEIVLRSEATASQLTTAFRALDAELVAGPTELGRYRVRLPAGAEASAAATALRAPETGVASFAEPLP
ncbi:MAG TPA: zf-HC2 domain-containing protein [Myxococcota bacterium]|nr:zf-HC2 domain-containing protein [Myxococcota bacterium]